MIFSHRTGLQGVILRMLQSSMEASMSSNVFTIIGLQELCYSSPISGTVHEKSSSHSRFRGVWGHLIYRSHVKFCLILFFVLLQFYKKPIYYISPDYAQCAVIFSWTVPLNILLLLIGYNTEKYILLNQVIPSLYVLTSLV